MVLSNCPSKCKWTDMTVCPQTFFFLFNICMYRWITEKCRQSTFVWSNSDWKQPGGPCWFGGTLLKFCFGQSPKFLLTLSCSSLSMNATGWPWRFPDGEVMGVFTSAWASTQMRHRSGHCWAWPLTDPMARLWKDEDSLLSVWCLY